MTTYFIRRFLLIIPTFFGVTILVFMLTRLVPGGPLEQALSEAALAGSEGAPSAAGDLGGSSGSVLSDAQLEQLKEYYGFDKNPLVSYFEWLGKVLVLDLGESTKYNAPVWEIIRSKLPVSMFYGICTLIITYGVCIPLGIVKAIRHNTSFDNLSSVLVFIGFAIPNYVVGIVLMTVFGSQLGWFPLGGFVSFNFEELTLIEKFGDVFYHAALPLIAYVAGSFAFLTMLMKNNLMDNLAADYVRTAIAKGQNFRISIYRHAMRNSLIPIATSFGSNLSLLIAGSFLIEKVFNIDGFGLLGFESLLERDYPVVMGIVVISSLLFMVGNILSDICVALVDPRVRFGSGGSNQ